MPPTPITQMDFLTALLDLMGDPEITTTENWLRSRGVTPTMLAPVLATSRAMIAEQIASGIRPSIAFESALVHCFMLGWDVSRQFPSTPFDPEA